MLQAAHKSFLGEEDLDRLPEPTRVGTRRLAGVDLQKPRMRRVVEALLELSTKPEGFKATELAERLNTLTNESNLRYTCRQASYDLSKLRGKNLIERVPNRLLYRLTGNGMRILTGLIVLREKVIKPVLAGAGKPRLGRPPKVSHPLDVQYMNIHREMRRTLQMLGLAA